MDPRARERTRPWSGSTRRRSRAAPRCTSKPPGVSAPETENSRGRYRALADVAGSLAALLEVLLVVLLGAVERSGLENLRHDRPAEALLRRERGRGRLRRGLLRRSV